MSKLTPHGRGYAPEDFLYSVDTDAAVPNNLSSKLPSQVVARASQWRIPTSIAMANKPKHGFLVVAIWEVGDGRPRR